MKTPVMIALAIGGLQATTAFQIPMVTHQIGSTPSRTTVSMSSSSATGSGKGLDYNPDKYKDEKNAGNYRKLSEALEVSVKFQVVP